MPVQLSPCIHFTQGKAKDAIALYERTLGARVEAVMRYSEMPGDPFPPAQKELVMHSELRIGSSALMISDAMPGQPGPTESGAQILLHFTDLEETRRTFDALAEQGKVIAPLEPMFWGATFGVLVDVMGVRWLFNCDPKNA